MTPNLALNLNSNNLVRCASLPTRALGQAVSARLGTSWSITFKMLLERPQLAQPFEEVIFIGLTVEHRSLD